MLVLLYAKDAATRVVESARLRAVWSAGEGMEELAELQGNMLPGDVAHFGYRDGFSQPTIAGGLPNPVPDALPAAPAGAFLLGYPSQFKDLTYPVPQPDALGLNGSFRHCESCNRTVRPSRVCWRARLSRTASTEKCWRRRWSAAGETASR